MPISDLFRPKWKHSDPAVRREAVGTLKNLDRLSRITINDPNLSVRQAALQRLLTVVEEGKSWRGPLLVKLIDDFLVRVAFEAPDEAARLQVLDHIEDQKLLADIAIRHATGPLFTRALGKLGDPGLQLVVRSGSVSHESALQALDRIDDQEWLRSLAIDLRESPLLPNVLKRLRDPAKLKSLVEWFKDDETRLNEILKRIDDPELLTQLVLSKALSFFAMQVAVNRIRDDASLTKIASSNLTGIIRCRAVDGISNPAVLTGLACAGHPVDFDVAHAAAARLEDASLLRRVANEAEHESARLEAAKKLSDPELLAHIAAVGQDRLHRELAVKYLGELKAESTLERLALTATDPDVRCKAILRLQNPDALLKLVRSLEGEQRMAAYDRLRTLAPGVVSGSEFADLRVELIGKSLEHLAFAEGYPFNAAAFNQDQQLGEAIEQLVKIARSSNDRAKRLLKAVHDHAVGCSDGVYAMRVKALHRGELRIALARRLADDLAEFASGQPEEADGTLSPEAVETIRSMEHEAESFEVEYLAVGAGPDEHRANTLKAAGTRGSDALAELISRFVACRSQYTVGALWIAAHVEATSKLVSVLRDALDAHDVVAAPRGEFYPEIYGEGRIGWTTQTGLAIKKNARVALQKLGGDTEAIL